MHTYFTDYSFEMILVEGGNFNMGTPKSIERIYTDELPEHEVMVRSFFLARYPVTQGLWRAVAESAPEFQIKSSPSYHKGEDRPVENVSWNEIKEKFLPALGKLTNQPFRLPSEAEWEYAARGGQHYKECYKYAGSDKLREVGWYNDNSGDETQPVGLLYPNSLGLHDMSGNVREWCEDNWHSNYEGGPNDGNALLDLSNENRLRVRRGGGFWCEPFYCRVACRHHVNQEYCNLGYGFRLALSFQEFSTPENNEPQ